MDTIENRPARRHLRAGFLAGLVAGGALTAAMFVLARAFGLFSLPELVGYRIIALLPLAAFSLAVETLGTGAKQILLLGATVGQVLVGGLLGMLWASLAAPVPGESRPGRRLPEFWNPTLAGGFVYALLLFALVEAIIFPLVGAGPIGARLPAGLGATTLALAILAMLYGLSLAYLYRSLMVPVAEADPAARPAVPLTRRQLLVRFGFGIAAIVVGAGAVVGLGRTPPAPAPRAGRGGRVGNNGLPPEITPTESFYSISKNFVDPKVEEEGWELEIRGMVERPYKLTLAEIKALPAVSDARTLCCISNEIGGDLISNATWKGVRLKDLLERAGVKAGAVDLAVGGRDGYVDSFPIEKALTPDVLAVYEMNGETLTDKHGFPLRLLVPDIYGMKNIKWLTRLDVVGFDYKGYWQEQGWSDPAIIKTMSRIDYPRTRALLPSGPTKTGGVAFAGARGVRKIEVSADGGQTWREGTIRRPLGPYTWVLWTAEVELPEGDHSITVRATDGGGVVQTKEPAPPLPDGSSGWHKVSIRAVPGVPAPAVDEGGV